IHITKGQHLISGFTGNPGSGDETVVSRRKWCTSCGGHLFTEHPQMGVTDEPAVVIRNFKFTPGFHVHYQQSVHPLQDGLPKFRDMPEEAGGYGIKLAEPA
ncbi:MAG: GFA family protein, partial [Gammaproteobacteria bacterium]|nr:GFA family protein [Gammaproteobacteria bacterium]